MKWHGVEVEVVVFQAEMRGRYSYIFRALILWIEYRGIIEVLYSGITERYSVRTRLPNSIRALENKSQHLKPARQRGKLYEQI